MVIFAGTKGFFDQVPPKEVPETEARLLEFFRSGKSALLQRLKVEKFSPEVEKELQTALEEFFALEKK